MMYFETGQGSALSADAHHSVDQQTVEARAYAVAREFQPLLVNTVVGFIGPEYLYDGKQIIRAGLEDHFCGKLLGLPMGVDVCYTNHAEADQDDMDALLTLLGVAGVTYVMGVPGADDVMLSYQSTSFHDALYLRARSGFALRRNLKHGWHRWGSAARSRPIAYPLACRQNSSVSIEANLCAGQRSPWRIGWRRLSRRQAGSRGAQFQRAAIVPVELAAVEPIHSKIAGVVSHIVAVIDIPVGITGMRREHSGWGEGQRWC